jgi:prepilin-type N-terminal cleavage/methylation domain-containing protein
MRRFSSAGFTVIELMIALVILAVVSSQLLLVFQSQKKAYVANERILDVQEDARLVMDLISHEARMAGFMVPRFVAVSAVDGGANAADTLCVSDSNQIDATTLDSATQPFDRSRPSGAIAAGQDKVTLAAGDLDLDGNAVDDFSVGQAVIVADTANTFCGLIEAIVGTELDLDRLFPIGFGTGARVVPAVMYAVTGAGGMGLTRNGLLLSGEVEDLQAEFGVDVNGDGLVDPNAGGGEFPLDNLNGLDSSRLLQVRLTVPTRAAQPTPDFTGAFAAAANRVAGGADNFQRRRFVSTVRPRNLGNP